MIVFPYNFNLNCTLLLQYSKYDTVRDLFSRIANSIETEHFRLWKVDKSSKPVSSFLSSINSQYENTNSVYVPGDIIANSDKNIMSLELENKFLLLIERAPKGTQNFCFKKEKPNKNSRSVGSNSKTKNNDLKTSINTITRPNNDSDLLIYEKEELPHIENQTPFGRTSVVKFIK